MAEIWVNRKCGKCGKQVTPGEKAILLATVNTTSAESYGNYRGAARKVRVNFFPNSPRELQHLVCSPTPKDSNDE